MMSMIKTLIQKKAPDELFAIVESAYWCLHPGQNSRLVYPSGECWLIITPEDKYYSLSYSSNRGSKQKQQSKYEKYTYDNFVEVNKGDVVVDIGAFLGEFSIPASQRANLVLSIEPDPTTYQCLLKQIDTYDNIVSANTLVSNSNENVVFKSSTDPSESSMIDIDAGDSEDINMQSETLDDICSRFDIDKIDFLKMDAEGLEPEVLRGIENIEIKKVAIDAGPERQGQATLKSVEDILAKRGYDTKIKNNKVVFGKLQ